VNNKGIGSLGAGVGVS